MTDELIDQQRHAMERDLWDVQDWDRTKGDVPTLVKLEEALEEIHHTAPKILADVHQTLTRPMPQLNSDLRPEYKPNGQIAARLQASDTVQNLRHHTVGDPFTSGLATSKMQHDLEELYEELAEVQEKADDAQQKADDYQDGCDGAGVAPGSPEAQADAALEAMRQAAEQAAAAADVALDAMGPVIDRQVGQAGQAAQKGAQDLADAVAGWGKDEVQAELSRTDPSARLALAQRLTTDRMVRIAEMFGRLRTEMWAVESKRWDAGHDEVANVTLSGDLERIVSSELMSLCDEDMELDFLDRLERKKVLTYQLRSRAKEARGGIVYVEDSSSSMYVGAGLPAIWARSIGLVLLDVAMRQKRAFRVIVFSSPGSTVEFDFGLDASSTTLEQKLAYAEFTMGGSTDIEGPLGKAIGALYEEYEATGKMTGDVVLATDDLVDVSAAWLERWNASKAELGFRCFGLTMGIPCFGAIEAVSDYVTEVASLVDGSDVARMFRSVTETKETTTV